MSVILKSGASSTLAGVDSNNNLNVVTPSTASNSGFVIAAGESTDGTAPLAGMVAIGRKNLAAEVNGDYQLRVGLENMLFYDIFNGVTLNTSVYSGIDTTMTKALSGGFLALNSGSSVTAGQGTIVRTYRTFTVNGPSPIYVESLIQISQVPQTNNVCEWGVMYASGVTIPTDGVYFRINNTGGLECVVNTNGIEQQTTVTGAVIAPNTTYHTIIAVDEDQAQFWFNDTYVAVPIVRGTAGAGITLGSSYPLMFREYNSNTVSTAQQFKIGRTRVSQGSIATNKPWNEAMSGAGLHSITTPPGVVTATQTANYVLSSGPVALTLASSGGYQTLGGQWQAVMVAGAETDYCIFNYQNPAGFATIPARNLFINNVRIGETFNTVAANAATPIILQWGAGVGSTSTAMSVADSGTTGARAPRRVVFGGQQFATGAAIGAMSPGFNFQFIPPVLVEPATYAQIYMRVVSGTATGNNIRGTVAISGNWE